MFPQFYDVKNIESQNLRKIKIKFRYIGIDYSFRSKKLVNMLNKIFFLESKGLLMFLKISFHFLLKTNLINKKTQEDEKDTKYIRSRDRKSSKELMRLKAENNPDMVPQDERINFRLVLDGIEEELRIRLYFYNLPFIFIILKVMKIRPLETHSKALQIEYRLSKYPYLSKESLPGTADAYVFQKLLAAHRMPTKQKYQNFYHWYIMMKQFAPSAIEGWIHPNDTLSNDKLIVEIMNVIDSYHKVPPDQVHHQQIQWVIIIQGKEEVEGGIRTVRKKLQKNFKSFKEKVTQYIENKIELRIKIKLEPLQCQQLKDALSRWDEVKRLEVKRAKKQPKV